jgi:hypothetical protein
MSSLSSDALHVMRVPKLFHPHQGKTSSKPQVQLTPRHKNYPLIYPFMWNHRGKVVEKFVGHRTWKTRVKSHVWVPKVLITNTLGPKYCWVPKRKA